MENKTAIRMFLAMAGLIAAAEIALLASGNGSLPISGLVLFVFFYALAFAAQRSEAFKGLSFTLQIFAFVSFTLYFPEIFTNWGFDTKALIVPSVQVIMFGMGTKLNLMSFVKEFSKPLGVIIGAVMIFVVMPLAAILIIKVWNFPPEVAAGVILLGACPTGAASNVMTYLAKGNLALSISITTLTTILAPFLTPLAMKLFAGQLIEVDGWSMFFSIANMMLIPIFAGIAANKILYGELEWVKKDSNLIKFAIGIFLAGVILIFVPFPAIIKTMQTGLIIVFWIFAIVAITMLVMRRNNGPKNWMDMVLPKLSLISIMLYIVITAAHNKETLLVVGPALFLAVISLNVVGFIAGYGTSKLFGMSDEDTRSITIEAGLKNGGVGVGLAYDVLKSTAAALAPLIFGIWMNISGSALASFWSRWEPKVKKSKASKD